MTVRTINIATPADLERALRKASGGETFVLAPGDYGKLKIKGEDFDSAVTIMSASATNRAEFSEISLSDSENIRFVNLDVAHVLSNGERSSTPGISVRDSENISFSGLYVHGTLNGDPSDDGFGFRIAESENVLIYGTRFEELRGAVFVQESSAVVLAENDVREVREGFDFQEVEHVLIEGNNFTNFRSQPGDHPDAIQFWVVPSSEGSRDVAIRGNSLIQGNGDTFQGIFVKAEGDHARNSNFVIENNAYSGSSLHGVSVYDTDGLRIENNTVVTLASSAQRSGINVFRTTATTLVDNIADVYVRDDARVVRSVDNIDYHATGTRDALHIDSLFVDAPDGRGSTINNFALRAGSRADALDAGFDVGVGIQSLSTSYYTSLLNALEDGRTLYVP